MSSTFSGLISPWTMPRLARQFKATTNSSATNRSASTGVWRSSGSNCTGCSAASVSRGCVVGLLWWCGYSQCSTGSRCRGYKATPSATAGHRGRPYKERGTPPKAASKREQLARSIAMHMCPRKRNVQCTCITGSPNAVNPQLGSNSGEFAWLFGSLDPERPRAPMASPLPSPLARSSALLPTRMDS